MPHLCLYNCDWRSRVNEFTGDRVTETMESRLLNPEFRKYGMKFSLPQSVRGVRSPVSVQKQKSERVFFLRGIPFVISEPFCERIGHRQICDARFALWRSDLSLVHRAANAN